MRKFLFFLLIFGLTATAQTYNPNQLPNTYRGDSNPLYWQNKMPRPGYWQQDVHYLMNIEVDEKEDVIIGNTVLQYWNNSPDTLFEVYFHVYQNAFQPCSYYHNLHQNNNINPKFGPYESEGLGTTMGNVIVNGVPQHTEQDNTVLKVTLKQPIPPNTSEVFSFKFRTYFDDKGSMRRRMKTFKTKGQRQYNAAHWYPRMAAYDYKFGWSTNQHLGREFYADFGTFDVYLNFPDNYIVGATGTLQNEAQVLPDTLKAKLDLKNFADKPWNSKPSTIIPYDSTKRKTWHFYAENVHDFAWTANPLYRIGQTEWDGIKAEAFALEHHAKDWQNAPDYVAKILEVFSEDFGRYEYPKMIAADARDGMEYPMITLDAGSDPGYRGLLVHEIAHNWFYGMLGSNETYRAFMDEGFTQFLTAWGLEKIDGPYLVTKPAKKAYTRRFKLPQLARDRRVYGGYMYDATRYQDAPLNTHSDGFGGKVRHGGGYRHVYVKTATMLYNLQYVLGDELFLAAMQNYVSQWKMAHPYPEDFRNSIINFTKVDLNWFFDQWLETTKNIDYDVAKVKQAKTSGEAEITFKRKGLMQMPIDFKVIYADGSDEDFHIPNNWFEKKTDATILPRWIGWDNNLNPTYTASIPTEKKVSDVIIDTTNRLADINMLNNSKKHPIQFLFESEIYNPSDWKKYRLKARPDIWYNGEDGIQLGGILRGDHMNYRHRFELGLWANTALLRSNTDWRYADGSASTSYYDPLAVTFKYKTGLNKWIPKSNIGFGYEYIRGMQYGNIGFDKRMGERTNLYFDYNMFQSPQNRRLNYALAPADDFTDDYDLNLNIGVTHRLKNLHGKHTVKANFRTTGLASEFDYRYLNLEMIDEFKIGKFDLKLRSFAQLGNGSRWSNASSLYLAGGNPEAKRNHQLADARGFIPNDWIGDYGTDLNHFHYAGGLNVRAMAGYLASETYDLDGIENAGLRNVYKGVSGLAFNAEFYFNRLLKIKKPKLNRNVEFKPYLFTDWATIGVQTDGSVIWSKLRADAGLGAYLKLKRYGQITQAKPLTLRFDMPFWANRVPAGDDNFKFRFVMGVNKLF